MKQKIVFMGTPQIAARALQTLIDDDRFDIQLVISQPDKPQGRGNKIKPTPVKEVAETHNIAVLQPVDIRNNPDIVEKLKLIQPNFFAVVAYGKILPQAILDIPIFAAINVHFSLLPLYRGAAPVNRAILNGDFLTGVSTMKMAAGMDTGDILLTDCTEIGKKDAVELANELSAMGARLLIKTLNEYSDIVPTPQNGTKATNAPMMSKDEGLIDWQDNATFIERKIRALVPWPTAYTYLDGKLLKIYICDMDKYCKVAPGVIYNVERNVFAVGTGDGGLIIKELQLEGKRRMTTAEFLTGYKLVAGIKLG